ncbi:DnaJ domain containing protein [Hordeum vulgare]|nr:DnaJ domain containing protein [Hordeum vulgare]
MAALAAAAKSTNSKDAATETTRDREAAAEEACRRAETLYHAGNFTEACRHARRAQQLFPALPGVANALAAYAIHAAAAVGSHGRPNWHAVLGLEKQTAATRDAIRRQFLRLSLLVHPDKNHSAAAEDAFKILRQACDTALLTAGVNHRPDRKDPSADSPRSYRPRSSAAGNTNADTNGNSPPAGAQYRPRRSPAGDTNADTNRNSPPTGAQHRPRRSTTGDTNADTNRNSPPTGAQHRPRTSASGDTNRNRPRRPAAGDTNADTGRNRPPAGAKGHGPRGYKWIYCWHCKREFGRQIGPVEELVGTACPRCNMRLRPPWDRKTLLDFTVLET